LFGKGGSVSYTSKAAPAIFPLRRACARAEILTIFPLAVLMIIADDLHKSIFSAEIIPLVSLFKGR